MMVIKDRGQRTWKLRSELGHQQDSEAAMRTEVGEQGPFAHRFAGRGKGRIARGGVRTQATLVLPGR